MPEHTIPESLLHNIRNGRAALVVGAGVGVPSWKQLLERMNEELRSRGTDAATAAAKDVDKLLHKGNLTRAAGFLGRQLGEQACDRIVAEVWQSPDDLSDAARLLARLPFRQVWTTFPGDVLERAMEAELPDGWPLPRLLTYQDAMDLDPRRRTLLKILGDYDSFIATPKSIRRALSAADDLREAIRPFYTGGSLLLVGFRYGDPDLAALLDRVFGAFPPPSSAHYLLAASVGPVSVDELENEHHIQVINLPGKGTDDTATRSLIDFLGSVSSACAEQGITLAQLRPDADDLEGWLARLADDAGDDEAMAAVRSIERSARDEGDAERLIEVLMSRVEIEGTAPGRAALLRQVAEVFEQQLGDLPRAFTALTAALREDPADFAAADEAERLADAADGWSELVGDVSAVASEIDDDELAAAYWTRLGSWYHRKLDHHEYATAAYREALRRNPQELAAYRGLGEVHRSQQKWGELAELLSRQIEVEPTGETKLDVALALGDLFETQLASTARAIEAYEAASELTGGDDALVALERLYRRDERWGKLAKVLEERADRFEAAGDSQRAGVIRRELGSLRTDKLGDLEGAIRKHEAALERDAGDLEALRALEDLYEKVGRTADYHRVLTQLVEVAPDDEQVVLLRRLAAELEEEEGGRPRAIEALHKLIDLDPKAEDAYRALERLLPEEGRFDDLLAVLERHVFATAAPAAKAELFARMGAVYEAELADPHRAIEAHQNAIAEVEDHEPSLEALPRLLLRIEAWQQAVDVLTQHAEIAGDGAASLWTRAGQVAAEKCHDLESAEQYLEKAIGLEPTRYDALLQLAHVHKGQKAWTNAVRRLADAADASSSRLEKIELLVQAAELADTRMGDRDRALELFERVLALDPEHVEVGGRVVERLLAAGRDADAVPVLEMLVRRAEDDRFEHARRAAELAGVLHRLGRRDEAARHYRTALEAEPDSLDVALGLSAVLFDVAQQDGDAEQWEEVDARCRELLARHRTGLADGQVVELWYRLGVAARRLGDDGKASDAFRRALERDPGHAASLSAMVDVAEARGDWKAGVAAKRELLERTEGDERGVLLEEIGDLCHQRLGDESAAVGAYLEALELRPDSHVLLHKTLEIYTEQKDWRQAVQTLGALARTESEPRRRAKYHYAAAVIGRDELGDVDLAVEHFGKALDDEPTTPKAFEAIDQLLEERGDWKNLARAHRRMLKRLGEDAEPERLLRLWTRLGEICADHLGDPESAIAAFEVATELAPDDMDRHEQLADLYLEAGEPRREEAIDELQILVRHDPDRVELYRALSELYRAEGATDKAYCLAQALAFLGAATDVERELYAAHRPGQLVVAKRRLTEELWQKSIAHQREDRHIGAIFSAMVGPIAATTAQPASAFNIAHSAGDDGRPVARVFKYAANVLGLSPEPQMSLQPGSEGLRVANTADRGKLAPTVLVGEPHADKSDERELAFEMGKRLAYFRPERYLHYALQTQPRLEAAFYASLLASGLELPGDHGDSKELAGQLARSVPRAVLEHVGAVAGKLGIDARNGVIGGWRTATDLTANRVGLILCNDLETAARMVATEAAPQSTLSAKDRLRDLLAYSVSEDYFAVRRHLGVTVEA